MERKNGKKGFRVGLALGGGAARALAHIGVLEVLQENDIPVDIVTGTSMGAVIGAMYAINPDVGFIRDRIFSYLESDEFRTSKFEFMREKDAVEGAGIFFRFSQMARKGFFYTRAFTRKAFVPEDVAGKNYDFLVQERLIEDIPRPFAAVSLDLISGEEVVHRKGSLRHAIMASCALPGVLHPVPMGKRLLVDGGWIDAVPVGPAFEMGADFVIGVDVSRRISEFVPPGSAMDILFRSDAISRYALAVEKLKQADIVLSPDVYHLHWADFSQASESIQRGREEAEAQIEEIRKRIRSKRWKSLFRIAA